LYYAAETPDGQGQCPGDHEQADDPVAHAIEVDRTDRGQDPGGDVELLGEDRDELDAADQQGDGHGQSRDGDVVVDLADRFGERPAIGEVHERAVDVV